MILIYLVVIYLYFLLWSYEKSDRLVRWPILEFAVEKAVEIAAALASNNFVD